MQPPEQLSAKKSGIPWGKKLPLVVFAMCATALWGSAFPFVKIGYEMLRIETTAQRLVFAGVRFAGAGCVTLLLARLLTHSIPRLGPRVRVLDAALLGLVQTGLQYVCFYIGLANTPGARASIIDASSAFIGVILAHFFTSGDRMNTRKAAGCIVGFLGILAMNLGGAIGGGFRLDGDALLFAAAVAFSAGSLMSRRLTMLDASPAAVSGAQLLFGGLALLAAGLLMGGRITIPDGASALLLFYLMLLSAGAFTLWALLLQHYRAASVSIFGSLIPVFGVVFSGIFLNEDVATWQNLLALGLVVLGILLVNSRSKNETDDAQKDE